MTSRVIEGPAGPIEVHVRGDGHPVVMLPSLGRGAGDFADLAERVAAAGHRAICPEPRGIGGSTAPLDALSMDDLAADAAAAIEACADGSATVVGHAFGNRVARLLATRRPELRTAFFAPGNDPSVWIDGWHGVVAAVQSAANQGTDVDEWWMAGDAEVLAVQAEQDVMAVPENAARIAERYGDRATVLALSNAGHAMLPEQPEEIARTLLVWLDLRGLT